MVQPKFSSWGKTELCQVPDVVPITLSGRFNSIEPLWGLMHKWVTHNRHYDTYEEFTEAITEFLETTLPENWEQFLDTVTGNF